MPVLCSTRLPRFFLPLAQISPFYALSFVMSGLSIAMLTGVQDAYIYDSLGDDADAESGWRVGAS